MFTIEDHGSLILVQPLTADVYAWLVARSSGQWYGGALVVEPRYLDDLVAGMVEEGFVAS